MRVVDEDTRRHVLQKRLQALEADNFQEETFNEEEEEDADGGPKRKKSKGSYVSKSGSAVLRRKPKSLDRILDEARYMKKEAIPYDVVAAGASVLPRRHFCSVCGFVGTYTCTRCGSRFCSVRCNNNHKETRCLKFSI